MCDKDLPYKPMEFPGLIDVKDTGVPKEVERFFGDEFYADFMGNLPKIIDREFIDKVSRDYGDEGRGDDEVRTFVNGFYCDLLVLHDLRNNLERRKNYSRIYRVDEKYLEVTSEEYERLLGKVKHEIMLLVPNESFADDLMRSFDEYYDMFEAGHTPKSDEFSFSLYDNAYNRYIRRYRSFLYAVMYVRLHLDKGEPSLRLKMFLNAKTGR